MPFQAEENALWTFGNGWYGRCETGVWNQGLSWSFLSFRVGIVGWAMAIQTRNFIHSASANCPKPFATSPWERTMLLLSRWIKKSMFGAKLRYLEKCNMYLISRGPKAWLDLAHWDLFWVDLNMKHTHLLIRLIHLGLPIYYTIFFPMNTAFWMLVWWQILAPL